MYPQTSESELRFPFEFQSKSILNSKPIQAGHCRVAMLQAVFPVVHSLALNSFSICWTIIEYYAL